jgi:hypothetical protein
MNLVMNAVEGNMEAHLWIRCTTLAGPDFHVRSVCNCACPEISLFAGAIATGLNLIVV